MQFSKDGFQLTRSKIVKLEDSMTSTLGKAGIETEYTGDADQPPPEQGSSELLGILAALIVLLIVFRTFVAAGRADPLRGRLGADGVRAAVPA